MSHPMLPGGVALPAHAPPSSPTTYPVRRGAARRSLAPVTTMLAPGERPRVDAAGEGLYTALHRDSLEDVLRDLRSRRATAVLLSVARCDDGASARMAALVREFPRVPAVALLTQLEAGTPHAVLALGQSGVRTLVTVWAKLLPADLPAAALRGAYARRACSCG